MSLPTSKPMSLRYLKSAFIALLFLGALHPIASAQGRCRVICYTTYDEDFFYMAASVQKPAIAGSAADLFGDPMKDDAVAVFLQVENDAALKQRSAHSIELAVSAAGGSQLYRGAGATPLKDFSDF